MASQPLLSLNKALLNPYFWGGYGRGRVGWPAHLWKKFISPKKTDIKTPKSIKKLRWKEKSCVARRKAAFKGEKLRFKENHLNQIIIFRVPAPLVFQGEKKSFSSMMKIEDAMQNDIKKRLEKHLQST